MFDMLKYIKNNLTGKELKFMYRDCYSVRCLNLLTSNKYPRERDRYKPLILVA